jgi:hypothetical protein
MNKKGDKPAALDHVLYEIEMFATTVLMMTRMQEQGVPNVPLNNACLESFAIHARNLNEFFGKMKGGDKMHPADFIAGWSSPYEFNRKLHDRASLQVAHLTSIRETPEEKTGWPIEEFFKHLRGPSLAFLQAVLVREDLMAYKHNRKRTGDASGVLRAICFDGDLPQTRGATGAPG